MNRPFAVFSLLASLILVATPAHANPRDADAVLARCGKPLKGDQTILENTVAGGRRILSYERGILHFDRVTTEGWTFTYGTHQKLDNLTAEEMEKYMPCLKDAFAQAAADAPIKKAGVIKRAEVDANVEHPYKMMVAYFVGVIVVLGGLFWWIARKDPAEEAS